MTDGKVASTGYLWADLYNQSLSLSDRDFQLLTGVIIGGYRARFGQEALVDFLTARVGRRDEMQSMRDELDAAEAEERGDS